MTEETLPYVTGQAETLAEAYVQRLRQPGVYLVIAGQEIGSVEALPDRTALRIYFGDGSHLDISLPIVAPLDFSWGVA